MAILDDVSVPIEITIPDSDLKIEWFSGTGAGGQNRNKVMCSCRLTHIPTGIVRSSQTRSRISSFDLAKKELIKAVSEKEISSLTSSISADRKQQVGSGMRGDKKRTYRFQDNIVVDHQTGKSARCVDILKGNFDLLWKK